MALLPFFQKPNLSDLLRDLAATHIDTTLTPANLPPRPLSQDSERFEFDVTHRVQIWYDRTHAVHSKFGTLTAYRAITLRGDLLWFVRQEQSGLRFHACVEDPHVAMDLAMNTWDAARQLRDNPAVLKDIMGELRRGRARLQVCLADAEATPLSQLGFRALLDSVGLFGLTRISGQTITVLMKKEPLLAHVLHVAWRRHQTEAAYALPASDVPVGFEAIC